MSLSRKKFFFIGIILVLSITVVFSNHYWRVQEYYFRYKFDLSTQQKPVRSQLRIESILEEFNSKQYRDLKKEYKSYTKSDQHNYVNLLQHKEYLEIGRNDFYKYIVGNFRIEDLLCKDKYYRQALSNQSSSYYWLINEKLLLKLLALQYELEAAGYDKHGFTITNGHRHPQYNERIGGAKLSRHIHGEAIDLYIQDINKNGKYDKQDKEIVLDILEKKVIRDEGGIGLYPNTRVVHFDVRGYRARWNEY